MGERTPLPLGEAQQHLNQIVCLGVQFCLARAGELSSGVKGPGLPLVIITQPDYWFNAGEDTVQCYRSQDHQGHLSSAWEFPGLHPLMFEDLVMLA